MENYGKILKFMKNLQKMKNYEKILKFMIKYKISQNS
jgi:hypothetical protein